MKEILKLKGTLHSIFGTVDFDFTITEFGHVSRYIILYSSILRVKFLSCDEILQ